MSKRLFMKIEVDFFDSPETRELKDDEALTYLRLVAYAKRHLTDGWVPETVVQEWLGKRRFKRVVGALLRVNYVLLERLRGANYLVVRSFLKHNKSRSDVEQDRESIRKRVARHRAPPDPCNAVTGADVTPPRDQRIRESEDQRPPNPHSGPVGPWPDPLGEIDQVWDAVELAIRGYRAALRRRGRTYGASPSFRDRVEFEEVARWAVEASAGKADRATVVLELLTTTLTRVLDRADADESAGKKGFRTPGTWRSRLVDDSAGVMDQFADSEAA